MKDGTSFSKMSKIHPERNKVHFRILGGKKMLPSIWAPLHNILGEGNMTLTSQAPLFAQQKVNFGSCKTHQSFFNQQMSLASASQELIVMNQLSRCLKTSIFFSPINMSIFYLSTLGLQKLRYEDHIIIVPLRDVTVLIMC